LVAHYWANCPKYSRKSQTLKRRDLALAESFTTRFGIWFAVHSLMIETGQESIFYAPARGA
jgi:hypothetical protein